MEKLRKERELKKEKFRPLGLCPKQRRERERPETVLRRCAVGAVETVETDTSRSRPEGSDFDSQRSIIVSEFLLPSLDGFFLLRTGPRSRSVSPHDPRGAWWE